MLGPWVRSLVRELRSHMLCCVAKKNPHIYEVLDSVLVTSQAWVQTTALHGPFTSEELAEVFLSCSLLLRNGIKLNVSKQQNNCILTKSPRWNIIQTLKSWFWTLLLLSCWVTMIKRKNYVKEDDPVPLHLADNTSRRGPEMFAAVSPLWWAKGFFSFLFYTAL